MNIEVIRPDGDLKRERWTFSLVVDWANNGIIYLNTYNFETRETLRHKKWQKQTNWDRLDKRTNNIDSPPLLEDVITEARRFFAKQIEALPIKI